MPDKFVIEGNFRFDYRWRHDSWLIEDQDVFKAMIEHFGLDRLTPLNGEDLGYIRLTIEQIEKPES